MGKKRRTHEVPEDIELKREIETRINKDPLVRLAKKKEYSEEELIKEILFQASREKAYLEILREQEDLDPDKQIALSKKIADIVKQMGDLALSLHRSLSSNEINLQSEGFKILLDLMLERLEDALEQARLDEEHKSTVFTEFGNALDSLEKDYRKELRAKGAK